MPAFSKATRTRPKTPVGNGKSLRRRWKDPDGTIYEWDSRHGTVEKYNAKRIHEGEFSPDTGRKLKPANPARRVEP